LVFNDFRRYGRFELLKYFNDNSQKSPKFIIDGISTYTIIHAACFGGEYLILKYILDTLHGDPTPQTYEMTPIKICVKAENLQLIELLISRGAFYTFNNFLNNMIYEKPPPVVEKLPLTTEAAKKAEELTFKYFTVKKCKLEK